MQRLNGWLHAGLGVAIGTCLVVGCIPAPTRAKLPGATGQEGIVRTALPPGMSGATGIAGRMPGVPDVAAPPLQAPSVISNNGGNVLKGSVRAPASIISHNGGNIISNNGGGIVSNNGGGIISHNGGNLQIVQVPLAYTTVRVKDAAGQPVRDAQGRELVAKTDADGNYSFPVEVKGRNLVIEADVAGQGGKLKSLLPKDGVQAGGSLDVDMTSTLTLAYILDQYVKGDLTTFERLPRDIEAKARVVTEVAIVEKQIALPTTLDDGAIVAKVNEVRKAEPKVDQVFEEIKRLLVIAGIVNEGDGLKSTEVDCGVVGGATTDAAGNIYVFSHSLHTLWRIAPDGILHTLVPKGAWGYKDEVTTVLTPGYTSGMVREADGSLVLADTYHNRVVRISPTNQVTVLAGTGVAGYGGDGGDARAAQFNRPSGLVIDAAGDILVSDTENHRVRKIGRDSKVQTVVGDGIAGYAGDGGPATAARVNRPQGLAIGAAGEVFIADYENSHIRHFRSNGTLSSYSPGSEPIIAPIALAHDGGPGVLCLGHLGGDIFRVTDVGIEVVFSEEAPHFPGEQSLEFPRTLALESTRIFVDTGMNVFGAIERDYSFSRLLGSWSATSSANGKEKVQFLLANKMDVDSNENIYVSDMGAKRILKVHTDGNMQTLVGNGKNATGLVSNTPTGIGVGMVAGVTLSKDGNLIFTSIGGFTAVRQYDFMGRLSTIAGTGQVGYTSPQVGVAANVNLANAYDIAQLPDGRLILSMTERHNLLCLNPNGTIEHFLPPEDLRAPDSLAVDQDGNLTLVEENAGRISTVIAGRVTTLLRQVDLGDLISLNDVRGLAYDKFGNLFIAGDNRVVKYGVDKVVRRIAGPESPYLNGTTRDDGLIEVTDINVSPSGHLYILEKQQLKRLSAQQLAAI